MLETVKAEPAKYERPENFEQIAYDNWKLGRDTTADQLAREIEDLEWQVGEKQWDDASRKNRGATEIDGIAIAARPMLSIPKIKQPMSIVANQFRSADLGVNVHPISEDANDDTAEVIQDKYREIERDSNASQARWWAFDRAMQAGRGYYRVNSIYDEATDDPNDQKIVIERILYQSAVVMDPAAVKADLSDAQWGMITAWLPLNVFKRRWPKAKLSLKSEEDASLGQKLDLEGLCEDTPEWANEGKGIQVAEYWHKHYVTDTLYSKDKSKSREYERCEVRWTVFGPGGETGLDVLEEQEWNGDQIPIIPAFWSELQPCGDERRYEGVVRPARDGGKLYNFMASEAVSAVGSLPKSPYIGDIRQFEPFMNAWKQSNMRIFPFLPVAEVKGENGQPLPPPQRVTADSSILQPLMIMLQQADDFIQSATATPDPVLGKANTRNQSGRAIQALQGQSEASNSAGIQNFADVTLMYEARVVIGMMRRIYGEREGRMTHVLSPEGKVRPVILNAPFTMDKNGRPQRVPAPVPGQTTTMQPQQNVKTYDLSKGFYGVSVTIGKSFNTRREQGAELLSSIMEKDPELGVVLSPVLLRFMDGPGMKEAAELAKEYRDMKYPGLGQPKDGTMTPEVLQQKLKASEMQIQQMQQAGAELQKQIETDVAKQQATMAKVQSDARLEELKIEAELRKAEMDNAARIEVANIGAKSRLKEADIDAIISLTLDRTKKEQEAFNRRHESELHHSEQAHDVALALGGQEHEQDLAERGHAQSMEQQSEAQAAAAEQADADRAIAAQQTEEAPE